MKFQQSKRNVNYVEEPHDHVKETASKTPVRIFCQSRHVGRLEFMTWELLYTYMNIRTDKQIN